MKLKQVCNFATGKISVPVGNRNLLSNQLIVDELNEVAKASSNGDIEFREVISPAERIQQITRLEDYGSIDLVRRKVDDKLLAQKTVYYERKALNEMLALALLKHENIVALHEAGIIDQGMHKNFYAYRIDYVENHDYFREIDFNNSQQLNDFLELFKKVVRAINHVHSRGIIHRDLKPKNILLSGETVKVIDFELAKIQRPDIGIVTGTEDYLTGTVNYMAPEQFENASKVDFTSDLYSLAVIMIEVLTGYNPIFLDGKRVNKPVNIKELTSVIKSVIKNETFASVLLGALSENQRERSFKEASELLGFLENLNADKLRSTKALC